MKTTKGKRFNCLIWACLGLLFVTGLIIQVSYIIQAIEEKLGPILRPLGLW